MGYRGWRVSLGGLEEDMKGGAMKMNTYTFEVVIEEDEFEDGRPAYHAYCPALP